MDCWHRHRWIMNPFLRAGVRDIGLSCSFDDPHFDKMYLDQLLQWVSQSSLEAAVLLAYEWVHDDRGAVRKDLSDLFVSNDAVFAAVKRSSKLLPGVAIHPARPDALDELERLLHGTDSPVVTAVFPSWWKGWIDRETMLRLRAIRNPLEKKIQLTKALGFPDRVLTDLWQLLPAAAKKQEARS